MAPTAVARPLMSNANRLAPVARPGTEERPSSMSLAQGIGNGAKGWGDGGNIWAQNFRSVTRDSSRTRDPPAFLGSKEGPDNKTPTGTFGQALDTNVWNQPSPRWDQTGTMAQNLSSGVSPDRRGSGVGLSIDPQPSHMLQHSRVVGTKSNNAMFGDLTSFGSTPRQSEGASNGVYGHFQRSSTESSQPQESISSWPDTVSPTDDRRSMTLVSSGANSRNPSLPPSRNGLESLYQTGNGDNSYSNRFGSIPTSRNGHAPSISSISNGRFPSNRQNSAQSDSLPQLIGRVSIESEDQTLLPFQRQFHSNGLQNSQADLSFARGSHDYAYQYEAAAVNGASSYNADNAPTFSDPFRFQRMQMTNGGTFTPGAADFRPASYYSSNATPPGYDSMYSNSRIDPRYQANIHPQMLDRRLRGIQQEQAHAILPRAPYQPSMMNPQRQAINSTGYTPPFAMYNGVAIPMSSLIALPPQMPLSMLEPPRGPREAEGMSLQSQLLVDFKATAKGSKQWHLKDIQGHVAEFCGDQVGSRFIQTKLETANSEDKALVFNEMLPEVVALMQDVFGNYVIQKFFDHGDQIQKGQIAASMKGHLIILSTQMYACRVVQKAIDHILTSQQASLIKELEPNVIKCVKDMNGNHVVQKAIERIPGEHIQFILDQFNGKIGELSTHTYGCRVIQRVLEFGSDSAKRTVLAELHTCGSSLVTDSFGNYVTQHMIQHGFPEDRDKVIEAVKLGLILYSKHKFASNVVEKCLTFGTTQQRHDIMQIVLKSGNERDSGLLLLIKDGFGNYVVQKMLETIKGEDHRILSELVQIDMVKAKRTVSGKQLASIEKALSRISRTSSIAMASPVKAATAGASPTQSKPLQTPLINMPSPEHAKHVDSHHLHVQASRPVIRNSDVQHSNMQAPRPAIPLNHSDPNRQHPSL